jgi:purine-binding chemotaxis protein CheW
MSMQSSICTFWVAGHHLGVEVNRVQEVIREQRMTRVPGASPAIRGLMNLRGQIITAIDLRRRLGLSEDGRGESHLNVVLRTADGPVSLLVDQIGDVLSSENVEFEPPPETLQGVSRELIRGAFKLEGQLLLVVDADAVLRTAA